MEPIEPPWQAIKEWIAAAPLWPCGQQDPPPDLVFHNAPQKCGESIPDDEPDLDWFNRPRNPSNPDPDWFDQTPTWKAPEIQLDDDRILVLESTRRSGQTRRTTAAKRNFGKALGELRSR